MMEAARRKLSLSAMVRLVAGIGYLRKRQKDRRAARLAREQEIRDWPKEANERFLMYQEEQRERVRLDAIKREERIRLLGWARERVCEFMYGVKQMGVARHMLKARRVRGRVSGLLADCSNGS